MSAIGFVMAILFAGACGHVSKSDSDTVGSPAEEHAHGHEIILEASRARAAGVAVSPVKRERLCRTLKVGGRLLPAAGEETTVVASVAGVVNWPDGGLSEGMPVRKGARIARLTAGHLLDGNPAAQAREEWETARREQERLEALMAEKLVTQAEVEEARLRCSNARAAYEGVRAYASAGGVDVPAPMGGFVKRTLVAQGEYVTAGQPLAVLTQACRLRLKAEVGEADWDFLSQVDNAVFRTAADSRVYDVKALDGRLLSVGQSVDEGTFYVPVTFEFNNVGHLLPGAYAEVWLRGQAADSVLAVPLSALTESQGVFHVYVQLDADGYEEREVKTGASDGVRIEIRDGLRENERVVTEGAVQVKLAASAGVIPEGHNHNH